MLLDLHMLRSFRKAVEGAALVEATLMMPLLFSMAMGTFEFGRALQHHHVLNKGVRDATRYLTQVGVTCPAASATGSVDDAADITAARNLAMTGYLSGGAPLLSYWTAPSTVTVAVGCLDNTAGSLRGASWLPVITVTASVPYTDAGFLSLFGFSPITLSAVHEELHIGG